MSELYVLSSALARKLALPALRRAPELRKATDQMLWAFEAARLCLADFPVGELGLVVGSGQGELETTKEFYRALALEGAARPFLFQNSLHHSTAGLLSLALKIKGPAVTVSDAFFSGESALDMAATLLDSRQCLACLVIGVDTLVPDLEPGVRTRYPKGLELGEGAAALLVARKEGLARSGRPCAFVVESWGRASGHSPVPPAPGYYEANAIACLAESQNASALTLPKPDGSCAHFRLRANP
jgi:3-oxoacyl-(acyl-carrier-protein) synthase